MQPSTLSPCACWDEKGSAPSDVRVWVKGTTPREVRVVSKYFLDPRRHVLHTHWSAKCLNPTLRKTLKEELFKGLYGLRAVRARCLCCGVNEISFAVGGQCCLAHVVPACRGGPGGAHNLIPTCLGCNSRYAVNLFDFMGLREDLCRTQLPKLVARLFKFYVPSSKERRKLKRIYGKKTLVYFLHERFAPPKLQAYEKCLL